MSCHNQHPTTSADNHTVWLMNRRRVVGRHSNSHQLLLLLWVCLFVLFKYYNFMFPSHWLCALYDHHHQCDLKSKPCRRVNWGSCYLSWVVMKSSVLLLIPSYDRFRKLISEWWCYESPIQSKRWNGLIRYYLYTGLMINRALCHNSQEMITPWRAGLCYLIIIIITWNRP